MASRSQKGWKQSRTTTQENREELEKLEDEMIFVRRKTDEESFQSKFVSISKTLDDILSCQRSSSNEIGLVYDKGMRW